MKREAKLSSNSYVRPPIVAVLGHVDHGKTTLLDIIRKSDIAQKEHGGITQRIGAWQVDFQGKKITFIDTPGHSAFEKMRSHGAQVSDIALLVVAADDGVREQTREAINHIKNASIPFIVVITKTDLEGSNPNKAKKELVKENVVVEEEGGDIVCVETSAKEEKGITELLEMILLVAELSPPRSDPEGDLEAIIIESQLDRSRGPLATAIVKNGTLKIGQRIVAENIAGKVRSLTDSRGENIIEAPPSTPTQVLGLSTLVPVGAILKEGLAQKTSGGQDAFSPIAVLKSREEKREKFKIIVKTDFSGSLDAIISNLPEDVDIVAKGVGNISENDLLLARSSGAIIYGFNIASEKAAQKRAEIEHIKIKLFRLIYELLEDIDEEIKKIKKKKSEEEIKGRANIIAMFDVEGTKIAGLKILDGFLEKGGKARVLRGDKIVGESNIATLKHRKKDIEKADKGMECGVSFLNNIDFDVNDSIEFLAS